MKHCNTIQESPDTTPATVLDGVGWPGLTLLLAGVLTLTTTFGHLGADPGARTGTGLALIALVAGLTWAVVEHRRYLTGQQPQQAEHRAAAGE